MRKIFTFIVLAGGLAGCNWNPSFMPTGYGHYHGEYKSPPAPEAPDIGYEYSAQDNEELLMAWRYALKDLLLMTRDHKLPQTVHLVTDLDKSTAFLGSYDYILREGLRFYGHTLTEDDSAPKVFYSAYIPDLEPDALKEWWSNDATIKPMALVLGTLDEEGILANEVRATYNIPVLDYSYNSYIDPKFGPLKQRTILTEPPYNKE